MNWFVFSKITLLNFKRLKIKKVKSENAKLTDAILQIFTTNLYYAAARVAWGRKAPAIEKLMDTLEIIVTRKLILANGRISALFYQLAPKHFKLIRE